MAQAAVTARSGVRAAKARLGTPTVTKGGRGTTGPESFPAFIAALDRESRNIVPGSSITLPTNFPRAEWHYADITWAVLKQLIATVGVKAVTLTIDEGFMEVRTVTRPARRGTVARRPRQYALRTVSYNLLGHISFRHVFDTSILRQRGYYRFKGLRTIRGTTLSFNATLAPGSTGDQISSILKSTAYTSGTLERFTVTFNNKTGAKEDLARDYASKQFLDLLKDPQAWQAKIAAYNRGTTTVA